MRETIKGHTLIHSSHWGKYFILLGTQTWRRQRAEMLQGTKVYSWVLCFWSSFFLASYTIFLPSRQSLTHFHNAQEVTYTQMCVYVDYTHAHIHAQSCPALCDPMDCSQPGFSPQNFPGKNTGVGCHFLLQGIFPTQGSNLSLLHLLHWQADPLPMSYQGSLIYTYTDSLGYIKSKYECFLNYAFSISELKCIGFKWKK